MGREDQQHVGLEAARMITAGHSVGGKRPVGPVARGHRIRWTSQPRSQVKVTERDPLRCKSSNDPCDLCDLSREHLERRGY